MTATADYIDPWLLYEHPNVGWNPHDSQVEVLDSFARHRVWCAGRRTGKSELGGHIFLPEIYLTKSVAREWLKEGKRREFWIVGDEYVTAEKEFRVIWHLCKNLGMPFDRGSHHSIDGKSQSVLSLWGGAFLLITQSAKYPENLVGEALCGVEMVEAAKSKPSTWQKYVRPMLNDYGGWSLHTSTPEGKNHFYEKFEMGQDEYQPDWASWRMPAWRNPFVYTEAGRERARTRGVGTTGLYIPEEQWTRDGDIKFLLQQKEDHPGDSAAKIAAINGLQIDSEILSLADELTTELFKQEVMADFTEFVGQVFKEYDEEYHVGRLEFNPDWNTFAAVDYGFTNPNVWLLIQEGPWGEINVLDEVYESGLTADAFAEEIKRRGLNPPGLRVFYPDPASPGDSQVLKDKLELDIGNGTGGELKTRLNLIRQRLRAGRLDYAHTELSDRNANEWRPQLMFDRRCVRTRADFMAYRYPERKEDMETSTDRMELPMKKDDHGPEALGRFMVGRYGAGSLTRGLGSRVTKGNAGRTRGKSKRSSNAGAYPPPVAAKSMRAMTPVSNGYPNWSDERAKRGIVRDEDLRNAD